MFNIFVKINNNIILNYLMEIHKIIIIWVCYVLSVKYIIINYLMEIHNKKF